MTQYPRFHVTGPSTAMNSTAADHRDWIVWRDDSRSETHMVSRHSTERDAKMAAQIYWKWNKEK